MPAAAPARSRRKTDGLDVREFIESALTISKGRHAGSLLKLRPWQRSLIDDLFELRPDGLRRYRRALVGLPRKNGKSALASGLALFGLIDEPGAEVYSCAGDKEQARIVFAEARRSVEASPQLAPLIKPYRDVLEFRPTQSVYRVLSAEAYSKEGLNPSLVVFDEVHVQPNRELWDVMSQGMGARDQPLLLGITTAGVKTDQTGGDSLCYTMYQYGRRIEAGEVVDPSFFFRWWSVPDDVDHRDPAVWKQANPALGDYLHIEDFASTVLTTPENEFRTKRLNQWVSSAQAWLPVGTWDACATGGAPPDLSEVVLAFDGSFNNDSTALVVCGLGDTPHLDVAGLWERPREAGSTWTVPVVDVEDAIRAACRRWSVREIACDPHRWARTYQILEDEGLPIVEFPQSPQRMTPATQRFYEAVMNRTVTHSGDPRLARHLANAVLKVDSRGHRIVKETKNSPRKIDLAVAAVMALDRAGYLAGRSFLPAIY